MVNVGEDVRWFYENGEKEGGDLMFNYEENGRKGREKWIFIKENER